MEEGDGEGCDEKDLGSLRGALDELGALAGLELKKRIRRGCRESREGKR